MVLPAPFGPSSPKTSPRGDVEVDPVDRPHIAIALDQARTWMTVPVATVLSTCIAKW